MSNGLGGLCPVVVEIIARIDGKLPPSSLSVADPEPSYLQVIKHHSEGSGDNTCYMREVVGPASSMRGCTYTRILNMNVN
jgi:hypothetical protein